MMDRYTYLMAILDTNPTIVRLVLNTSDTPFSSVYWYALYGAPEGQPQVSDRVVVEAGTDTDPNVGYDDNGDLVASFWC
jgi:hypothetical protein